MDGGVGGTVAIYVAEALRGQLAQASSARAAGADGTASLSQSELRKTLKQLVGEALAQRALEEKAQPTTGLADPMLLSFAAARELPGAPALPPVRRVRGHRGGVVHDAIVCDPGLTSAAWVTRCNWRFGGSPHELLDTGETTCARCLSRQAVEARSAGFV